MPYRAAAFSIVNAICRLLTRPKSGDSVKHQKKYGPTCLRRRANEQRCATAVSFGMPARDLTVWPVLSPRRSPGSSESLAPPRTPDRRTQTRSTAWCLTGTLTTTSASGWVLLVCTRPAPALHAAARLTLFSQIGIRKGYIHLYADLYTCDLVLASPLGLRVMVGADGDKQRDYDFLSSIEVAIFDQAEAYHMQNVDHLRIIASVMNKIPVTPRNADITRIRQWALEGQGAFFRQTVIFSSVDTPELRALFARGANMVGRITFKNPSPGSVVRVVAPVRQMFYRVACESFAEAASARREFFLKNVITQVTQARRKHVLVFIPSYFDFVALRNTLKDRKISMAQLCEYTSAANVSRARSYFFHGQRAVLLYTERFHYHRRPRIRGLQHIIFVGLPLFPQ